MDFDKCECYYDLWKEVSDTFPNDRSILLELIYGVMIHPYPKHQGEEKFNLVRHIRITKKRTEYTQLTSNFLCFILKKLNCSIIDLNLKHILIFLNFNDYETLMKSAINECDELCIRVLNIFDVKYSTSSEKILLDAVLKSRKLNSFLAMMNIFTATQVKKELIFKILKVNPKIYSDVVKYRNLEVLKVFSKFKSLFKITAIELTELIDYSILHEHFDIFNKLKSFKDHQDLFINGQKVYGEVLKLHEMILNNDLKGVKTFTTSHPELKICALDDEVSALEKCIDCKEFKIFSFLSSKGFNTNNVKNLDDLIKKLNYDELLQIRFENDRYASDDPQAYLGILASKCKLNSLSKSNENYRSIQKMLKEVSYINEIAASMRIAALTNIQIYFDLVCETVKDMNPVDRNRTFGLSYHKEEVLYIGKDLSVNHRHGTFAHEIMHLVLFVMFGNKCLPYCKWDDEVKKEWEQIVQKYKKLYQEKCEDREEIIEWVFRYWTFEKQCLELIVRVVHLLAFYRENKEKLANVIEKHTDIFQFFRRRVFPNLKTIFYQTISLNNEMNLFEQLNESKLQIESTNEIKFLKLKSKRILIISEIPHHTLSRLLNEIKVTTPNKIEVNAKNIFVNLDFIKKIQIKKKFDDLIRDDNTERVIVNGNNEETLKLIKELTLYPDLQVYLIVDAKNKNLITTLREEFHTEIKDNCQWSDLKAESQKEIMEIKVKYKSELIPLKELIKGNPSTKILQLLSYQNDVIEVKEHQQVELSFYIDRKIEKNSRKRLLPISVNFTLIDFIENAKNDNIVLISDLAGSGKTTIMKKIYKTSLQSCWIALVDLKKHKKSLLDDDKTNSNFKDFIADEILSLTELEKLIFFKKYENNNAIILFDGFDEISPICNDNCIKMFKNHQQLNKSQIWITTRTHLELELERELNVMAHRIQPLYERDQIEFFTQYWKRSNKDENLVKACTNLLVKKIAKLSNRDFSIIGIMLPISFLAKHYEKKLTADFDSLIKILNIVEIFEKLLRYSVNSDDKLGEHAIHDIYILHEGTYETLALIHFLGRYHHLFGNLIQLDSNILEEFTRGGIIYYDTIDKIYFTHESYPEFILAKFIYKKLKKYNPKWQFATEFVDFYFQVMNDEKFGITRMFLNGFIEMNPIIFETLNLFKVDFSKKLIEIYCGRKNFWNFLFPRFNIKKTMKFFQHIEKERLGDLFLLNIMMVRSDNFNFYKKLIEIEIDSMFQDRQQWKAIFLSAKKDKLQKLVTDITGISDTTEAMERVVELVGIHTTHKTFGRLLTGSENLVEN